MDIRYNRIKDKITFYSENEKMSLKNSYPCYWIEKKRKKLNGVCFGNNIIITTAMLFVNRFHRFRGHTRDEEAIRDDLASPLPLSFPPLLSWIGYLFEQLAYLNRNGTSSLSES